MKFPGRMIDMSKKHSGNIENASRAWIRPAVQVVFMAVVLLIGLRFGWFVHSLSGPEPAEVLSRPAGVEAFLPISSLMSLVYFLKTGVLNRIHPAGLVIFSLTLVLALLVRRGFCSWTCPIGTISEIAHKFGKWLFGRNMEMPVWLDVPLQGLKFFLFGFFLYHIAGMPAAGLDSFIHGPYNRMADVKMYLFFANIGTTALSVIVVLLVLSILFRNFWCRYLCPYGAVLGLFSLLSPVAVKRDAEKCIGCGKCAKACPNRIAVNRKTRVNSPECTACFICTDACPAHGALDIRAELSTRPLSAAVYGFIIVAAFVLTASVAGAFNYWHSETSPALYKRLYTQIDGIGHPSTGGVSDNHETPHDWHGNAGSAMMEEKMRSDQANIARETFQNNKEYTQDETGPADNREVRHGSGKQGIAD